MVARKILVFLIVLGLGGWWFYRVKIVHPVPGIAAEESPQQDPPTDGARQWLIEGAYQVVALAEYRVHARVLGVKRYGYDRGAKIAPIDLALGWGRMSDWSVYGKLNISQRGRYYLYEWGAEGPPIPRGEIITCSANNHIVPADPAVASALSEVRADDVVWMEGELVEIRGPDGFTWRSSLTRDDTGNGACELFRVTNLVIEP